jgi:UDP-N-acetylmuramoyl-L-alanyl-D-glutamate--2,6-diaminopimelate ligase
VKLSELYEELKRHKDAELISHGSNPDITDLAYDSRLVSDGGGVIFACVRGDNADGHKFAKSAVANGALALLCERALPMAIPQIITSGVRGAMGLAASILYGTPSGKLKMIGLTGTNGKTTTTYITTSIVRASGAVCGMIGTVVYCDGKEQTHAEHTTPEGPDIQRLLVKMAANGASYCVMEASSHGLDQGRLDGCGFVRAGFSNLTPEHLEYHENMERYFEAKRKLFTEYMTEEWLGAANADDAWGKKLIDEFNGKIYGYSQGENSGNAYYTASITSSGISGMSLDITYPDGRSYMVHSPLIGAYNASNILESAVLADSLGFDSDTISRGVSLCTRIPGRLERYSFSNGVTAFVDFAHSEDGMKQAMGTLRSLVRGRLHVLWGAGGDRTPLKRPVVGELMARMADHVVISTDNPRSESPADIARDIEVGVTRSGVNVRCETILDRGEAIARILDSAGIGDVVLIAGKGPERHIDYKTHRVPFLDADEVTAWGRNRSLEVN